MSANKPSAPSAPQFREFWIIPGHQGLPNNRTNLALDKQQAYDYQEEYDGDFGPPKHAIHVTETAALQALQSELHRVQGIAADQQMIARDNFNDCLVMKEENQKLSAELAAALHGMNKLNDAANIYKSERDHLTKEVARLEAEVPNSHYDGHKMSKGVYHLVKNLKKEANELRISNRNLEVENERLNGRIIDATSAWGKERDTLRKLLSEAAESFAHLENRLMLYYRDEGNPKFGVLRDKAAEAHRKLTAALGDGKL